jgi:hypothetical protein
MAALVALGGGVSMAPAHAVPPTVTPSPGYDARLQEQRAAQSHYESAAPGPGPALRRHRKWIHDGAH